MTSQTQPNDTENRQRQLVEALVGYGVFCVLGLTSRFIPVVFAVFVAYGILFPLIYAGLTRNWSALGFSGPNRLSALTWGVAAGVVWSMYTLLFFQRDRPLSPLWGLQAAIALPMWLLVLSPFQEFFFRGWLQPRLQSLAGRRAGLGITALAFGLWHYLPQLEGTSTTTLPLGSPLGLLSTILAGLLFGYIFERTENIIAPCLAHAIGGTTLVLVGQMSFIHYIP